MLAVEMEMVRLAERLKADLGLAAAAVLATVHLVERRRPGLALAEDQVPEQVTARAIHPAGQLPGADTTLAAVKAVEAALSDGNSGNRTARQP